LVTVIASSCVIDHEGNDDSEPLANRETRSSGNLILNRSSITILSDNTIVVRAHGVRREKLAIGGDASFRVIRVESNANSELLDSTLGGVSTSAVMAARLGSATTAGKSIATGVTINFLAVESPNCLAVTATLRVAFSIRESSTMSICARVGDTSHNTGSARMGFNHGRSVSRSRCTSSNAFLKTSSSNEIATSISQVARGVGNAAASLTALGNEVRGTRAK